MYYVIFQFHGFSEFIYIIIYLLMSYLLNIEHIGSAHMALDCRILTNILFSL